MSDMYCKDNALFRRVLGETVGKILSKVDELDSALVDGEDNKLDLILDELIDDSDESKLDSILGELFDNEDSKLDSILVALASIDEYLVPENIKKDVTILGVTGTYEGEEG